MLRELMQDEINIISGGNANSNYEGGCARASVKGGLSGVAGGAAANALRGGVAGIAGGPAGIAAGALTGAAEGAVYGAISGAIGGYIGCRDSRSNNHAGGGNLGGDANAHSVNGQCHW